MSQINALPINGFTIADLALLAPGPGQFLEVGGATEGRIDIDALAAYARVGTATESQGTLAEAALQPSDAGATGLALLAAPTAADARSAIGAMANTAPEIITNANGTAYRWPNGLQICHSIRSTTTTTNLMFVNFFLGGADLVAFPAEFTTAPVVCPFALMELSAGWPSIADITNPITTTGVILYLISGFNGGKGFLGCIAIGTYTP